MALPRSKYVRDGEEGTYHCTSRCVRRAFLCGYDSVTHRDFSHRKLWLVDRLHHLAMIFAIDVISFSVLSTHYHSILRTRPDLVALWSNREVASRWLTLFPPRSPKNNTAAPPTEDQIRTLADCPERIALLRRRLCSLSWFMGRLNEFIARAANKEDHVKGRFWESRFKCQILLDEAAIAACMAYVDLNPIRAGLAPTPEESDFTSIQQRIRAWLNPSATQTESIHSIPAGGDTRKLDSTSRISPAMPGRSPADPLIPPAPDASWLCPIQSDSHRRGVLSITTAEYFDLVDQSGRILRSDKRSAIDPHLAPILLRIGANPDAWPDTISRFGSRFRLAAGRLPNLRNLADRLGKRWFVGVATARTAFTALPAQLA